MINLEEVWKGIDKVTDVSGDILYSLFLFYTDYWFVISILTFISICFRVYFREKYNTLAVIEAFLYAIFSMVPILNIVIVLYNLFDLSVKHNKHCAKAYKCWCDFLNFDLMKNIKRDKKDE
jgi:hypothetical protein